MLFNSIQFALFLPLVFAIFWLLDRKNLRVQNAFIIFASYVFYGWWDWRFLGLIVFSSIVDYTVGLTMAREERPGRRKLLLGISLAANLGILGFFKYFDFFIQSASELLTLAGLHAHPTTLRIILPVGISFYTFQTLSYTIDIYRRKIGPTRDLLAFFAFVSFFPQLVAGPIERAKSLLPQFLSPRRFNYDAAREGSKLILWGFLKKVVIADNLAPLVETVFSNQGHYGTLGLMTGLFAFALQIYGDFSGYSDIAIGVARLFGFDLMRNFAYPYFSRDIGEFWRRWHISLSTWFRDYVYIPLGGSRTGKLRRIFNIMVTFTVSGLWHGANWTFVIWGALNGAYYIPLMLSGKVRREEEPGAAPTWMDRAKTMSSILVTFFFTLLAWAFFRAATVGDAIRYIGGIFTRLTSHAAQDLALLAGNASILVLSLLFMLVEWVKRDEENPLKLRRAPMLVQWGVYLLVFLVIAWVGSFHKQAFIYFQF